MELYQPMIHGNFPHPFFLPHHLHHLYAVPQNYVHWNQTPDSHVFTADLPGVRKEEIRVEVEDGRYLVIRTDRDDSEEEESSRRRNFMRKFRSSRRRNFMRKFRLPAMVNLDGISARYEDGVLTVRVLRSLVNRRPRPRPEDVVVVLSAEDTRNSVARAA